MNKKENTYTVVVHEVGKDYQIREHVDQLSGSMLPKEFEMAFPEEFADGNMWVKLILEEEKNLKKPFTRTVFYDRMIMR